MNNTENKSRQFAELPFAIDRNETLNLPEQVAEGFRKAIYTGYYKPGDTLPARSDIAKALNVSLRVPREAIAILAAENLIRPRRGVGCTVLSNRETLYKGRILLVNRFTAEGSYFCGMMMAEVRRCLSCAGYSYSCVTVDMKAKRKYSCNTTSLKEALRSRYDVALAVFPDKAMTRLLRKALPTIFIDGTEQDSETIQTGGGSVPDEMVCRCRTCGIKKIMYAGYDNYSGEVRQLRSKGFKVEHLPVRLNGKPLTLENLERYAFDSCLSRFSNRKKGTIPQLIYFADDYIARGGLTALLTLGIRVPEEIKVVTLSNKGFAPVFPVSLAQYEHDPVAFGRYVAERIIGKAEGHSDYPPPAFRQYRPGESFP